MTWFNRVKSEFGGRSRRSASFLVGIVLVAGFVVFSTPLGAQAAAPGPTGPCDGHQGIFVDKSWAGLQVKVQNCTSSEARVRLHFKKPLTGDESSGYCRILSPGEYIEYVNTTQQEYTHWTWC